MGAQFDIRRKYNAYRMMPYDYSKCDEPEDPDLAYPDRTDRRAKTNGL